MVWEILLFLGAEFLIATYFSFKIEGRIHEVKTLQYIILLMIFTFIVTFAIAFYNQPLFSFIKGSPIFLPLALLVLSAVIVGVYIGGSKLGTLIKKLRR